MTDLYWSLLGDLADEHAELDAVVAPLAEADWSRPTPAEGWTIRDTILHLALTDEVAALAADDPAGFEAYRQQGRASGVDPFHSYRGMPAVRWIQLPTNAGKAEFSTTIRTIRSFSSGGETEQGSRSTWRTPGAGRFWAVLLC